MGPVDIGKNQIQRTSKTNEPAKEQVVSLLNENQSELRAFRDKAL